MTCVERRTCVKLLYVGPDCSTHLVTPTDRRPRETQLSYYIQPGMHHYTSMVFDRRLRSQGSIVWASELRVVSITLVCAEYVGRLSQNLTPHVNLPKVAICALLLAEGNILRLNKPRVFPRHSIPIRTESFQAQHPSRPSQARSFSRHIIQAQVTA